MAKQVKLKMSNEEVEQEYDYVLDKFVRMDGVLQDTCVSLESWEYFYVINEHEVDNSVYILAFDGDVGMSALYLAHRSDKRIKAGDTVVINGREYKVRVSGAGWYLYCIDIENDNNACFPKPDYAREFVKGVLGKELETGGIFPFLESEDDLKKVVDALKKYWGDDK